MPEHDSNDKLTLTLDALRSDVERTPLADSMTVRRRGDQRTRRQAVGGAVAVVALVAGVLGVLGGVGGINKADGQIPAHTSTPTPTPTPAAIASTPFVATNLLTGLGDYDAIGPFLDSGGAPADDPQACDIHPANWGAAEMVSRRFYQDGSEATIDEYVLRFDDAGQATAALLRPAADLAACPDVAPADGTVEPRIRANAPVEGAQATSRLFTPTVASEPSYQEVVAVNAADNVVVVLAWHASGSGRAKTGWTFTDFQVQAAIDAAVAR
jgi:hypothetical protein